MTSTRDLIVLTIETLTESVFEVIMHKHALVSDLKMRIRHMIGIETQDQHILLGSVELKDDQTLDHYHLKTGSKLKLVTAMKGGPISYRTASPPSLPPLLGLATFLFNSSETAKATARKESEKNENKKNHSAYYVLHDGMIIKIKEFVSENADDDADEYMKRLNKIIDADETPTKSIAEIENNKLKEKMQNVRKNMKEANLLMKEKLKKKFPRPDVPPMNDNQHSKSKNFSYQVEEALRISKMSKNSSIEKNEAKNKKGGKEEEKRHEKNENEERDVKKKSNDHRSRMESNASCELHELMRITPIQLAERPMSIRRIPLPVANQTSVRFQNATTLTPKSSEQINLRDVDRLRHSARSNKNRLSLPPYIRDNNKGSTTDPIYNSGLFDSTFMNSKALQRQVKFEKRGKNTATVSNFKGCDENTKETKRKNNSQMSKTTEYDSLLNFMSLMKNTRRSWDRNFSSGHCAIGLISRRYTHDGLTDGSKNFEPTTDSFPNLHPIVAKKLNLLPQPASKRTKDLRTSGEVVMDRCALCNKKLGITNNYKCRCNKFFCTLHKFPEDHNCEYDYKKEGKEKLKKDNPAVTGAKIKKL